MSLRDVLVVLLVLVLISYLFPHHVPLLFSGPLGIVILILLLLVLFR
jgi:hypothetical protein